MISFRQFLKESSISEISELMDEIKNSNHDIYFDFNPYNLTFELTLDPKSKNWPIKIQFNKNEFDQVCRSLLIAILNNENDKKRILNQKSYFMEPIYKELDKYSVDTSISKRTAKIILNKKKPSIYNI